MLFFTLSGFLMTVLYSDKKFNQYEATKYLIARFARIYPLFFFVIFTSFLIYTYVDPAFAYDMSLNKFIRHAILIGHTSVFWTIPPEIQFYLVFVLIWLVLQRYKYGTSAMLFFSFLLLIILSSLDYPGPKHFVGSVINFFLAGVFAAAIYKKWSERIRSKVTGYELSILLGVYVLMWPGLSRALFGLDYDNAVRDVWKNDWFALMTALIVLFAAIENDHLSRVLSSRLLRWLGAVSFSMYLIHVPLLNYAMQINITNGAPLYVAYGGFWVVLIILAHASLMYLENPMRRRINLWGEHAVIPLLKGTKLYFKALCRKCGM